MVKKCGGEELSPDPEVLGGCRGAHPGHTEQRRQDEAPQNPWGPQIPVPGASPLHPAEGFGVVAVPPPRGCGLAVGGAEPPGTFGPVGAAAQWGRSQRGPRASSRGEQPAAGLPSGIRSGGCMGGAPLWAPPNLFCPLGASARPQPHPCSPRCAVGSASWDPLGPPLVPSAWDGGGATEPQIPQQPPGWGGGGTGWVASCGTDTGTDRQRDSAPALGVAPGDARPPTPCLVRGVPLGRAQRGFEPFFSKNSSI